MWYHKSCTCLRYVRYVCTMYRAVRIRTTTAAAQQAGGSSAVLFSGEATIPTRRFLHASIFAPGSTPRYTLPCMSTFFALTGPIRRSTPAGTWCIITRSDIRPGLGSRQYRIYIDRCELLWFGIQAIQICELLSFGIQDIQMG